MSVGDSVVNYGGKQFTTLNAIPFASLNDPRVPVRQGHGREAPRRRRRPDAAVHSADLQEPRRSDPDGLRHRRPPDRSRGEAQRQRLRRHDDDPQQAAHGAAEDRQLPADDDDRPSRRRPPRRTPRSRCSSARRRCGNSLAASGSAISAGSFVSTAARRTRFTRVGQHYKGGAYGTRHGAARCRMPSASTRSSRVASTGTRNRHGVNEHEAARGRLRGPLRLSSL